MDPPDGVDSRHRRRPVGLVGNLLHPATATGDPEGVAHAIADSQLWVPDHLAIVLGLILVLGGLVAIARSIHGGLPGALARLGSVAAVAGVTVGLILVTSTAWPPSSSPRPGQPRHRRNKRPRCGWSWPRRPSTSPWRPVQHLFAGVTFILYGLAVAWSQLYPRWLGLGSGPGRSRLGSGRPNPGIGGRGHHGDQDPDHHHPHHHHPMVDPDGQMGILAFRRAPSTEGAIAGSLKAAAQAHRSGPARRCRRSKKAAWAAVQPTMSTAGTASGHLGMPRTRLDHKLRCHAAERVLHGLLVDGRGKVRARPAGRARSPCRRRCPHRVTLVIAG
jgi:hypothetical protein